MVDNPESLVRELQNRFPNTNIIGDDRVAQLIAKISGFVETPMSGLALRLDIQGTAFQLPVWRAL
ncbi:hypothetical protein [Methyloglobulus sp.]|uniref:hypothetical protein n=1 Tax=Methyloglobulus sp. TaxID=2518622 RepID=UPI00398A4ED9